MKSSSVTPATPAAPARGRTAACAIPAPRPGWPAAGSGSVRTAAAAPPAPPACASGAPMQMWAPPPKATCGLCSRLTSNASGSSNTSGSRLAARRKKREALLLLHRAAADLHVARGDAAGDVHRRLVAQRLLDHRIDQLRVGLQLGQLGRIEQQQAHGVADQVGGGEVAADQQRREVDPQLDVAHRQRRRPAAAPCR